MLLVWFSVKTVLLTLCLTKCNTKFVFFFCFMLFFISIRYLLKEKKGLKKKVLKNNLKAYLNSITVIILPFKENPNFQVILNWILQILLLHCSKQHRNIEKLLFIEQNVVITFCPSLCLLRLVLLSLFSRVDVFQFLDTVLCEILNVTSDHMCGCKKTVFTIISIYLILYLQL